MQLIQKYFPALDDRQEERFRTLLDIVPRLNNRVNIISRKDTDHLEERHVLHSLSIAKAFPPFPGSRVIDVGTGGGFPGVPLAILFPETLFTLVDSIGKKVRLVKEIAGALKLDNVEVLQERAENLEKETDFIVSRAVAPFPRLVKWTSHLLREWSAEGGPAGWIALKGGDLEMELKKVSDRVDIRSVSDWFEEPFFSTKKIVYLKK